MRSLGRAAEVATGHDTPPSMGMLVRCPETTALGDDEGTPNSCSRPKRGNEPREGAGQERL